LFAIRQDVLQYFPQAEIMRWQLVDFYDERVRDYELVLEDDSRNCDPW